jgi:hypothetical protein
MPPVATRSETPFIISSWDAFPVRLLPPYHKYYIGYDPTFAQSQGQANKDANKNPPKASPRSIRTTQHIGRVQGFQGSTTLKLAYDRHFDNDNKSPDDS